VLVLHLEHVDGYEDDVDEGLSLSSTKYSQWILFVLDLLLGEHGADKMRVISFQTHQNPQNAQLCHCDVELHKMLC
jgi:hypothetical protein